MAMDVPCIFINYVRLRESFLEEVGCGACSQANHTAKQMRAAGVIGGGGRVERARVGHSLFLLTPLQLIKPYESWKFGFEKVDRTVSNCFQLFPIGCR